MNIYMSPHQAKMAKLNSDPLLLASYRALVFDWMEANGVAVMTLRFHGENDDGNFDSVPDLTLAPDDGRDANDWKLHKKIQKRLADAPAGQTEQSMRELFYDLCIHVEESVHHGVDWVNNEGGQGAVQWILGGYGEDEAYYRRGICFTVEARVISFDTAHYDICGRVEDEPNEPVADAAEHTEG